MKYGFIFLDVTKNVERREIPINQAAQEVFSCLVKRLNTPFVFYDPKSGKHYLDLKKSFHTALKNAEWEKCTKCSHERQKTDLKELGDFLIVAAR